MRGHLRRRGDSWEARVYVGKDVLSGKERYATRTIRGSKKAAERVLNQLLVDAEQGTAARTSARVGELLMAWFEFARHDFSPKTVRETRGFIERDLVPVLGDVPLTARCWSARRKSTVICCVRPRSTRPSNSDVVAGASGREVATVIVSEDRDSNGLRELATANRGVGLIVAESTSTSGAHIVVESDGSAELRPMSVELTAASLPGAAIAPLVELLEVEVDLEPMTAENVDPAVDLEWFTEDTALEDAVQPAPVGEGASIGDAEDHTVDEPPVAPEILVSVFGRPAVADFPKLGRMDTNVVVFLATNGGEATDGQLIDAVWNGRMVEQGTVWNRISKVRSIVGPLLPARASGDDTIRLAPSVRTDLDYVTAPVDSADDGSSDEAIGLLSKALELVTGRPFDAPGYEWAHQHQHHGRACDLVESTAIRLVDLALDAGALGAARRGVAQALKALPAHEPLYRARMRLESAAEPSSLGGSRPG